MKKCTYCGKEYPDEASVCAIDQEPLLSDAPAPSSDYEGNTSDLVQAPIQDHENQKVPDGFLCLGRLSLFGAARVLQQFEADRIRVLIRTIEKSVPGGVAIRQEGLIDIYVDQGDCERATQIIASAREVDNAESAQALIQAAENPEQPDEFGAFVLLAEKEQRHPTGAIPEPEPAPSLPLQVHGVEKADVYPGDVLQSTPTKDAEGPELGASPAGPVTFQREEQQQHPTAPHITITKRIYSSTSKEAAIGFLRKQNVAEPFYYVEIDTLFGTFGIDNGGRIYDSKGQFIEAEPESEKVTYDDEISKVKAQLEAAMQEEGPRLIPQELFERRESSLRCLRVIIDDSSADFYLRRMAVWWGGQFKDDSFNTFLRTRFIEGKDRWTLYQRAESSQSLAARAEEGLHIAAVDILSGMWKP